MKTKKILTLLGLGTVSAISPIISSCTLFTPSGPILSRTYVFKGEEEDFKPTTKQRGGALSEEEATRDYLTTAHDNPLMFVEDIVWNMAPINLSSNTTTMAIYTIDFYGIDVTTSRCSFDITTQFIDAEEQQRNNKTTVSVKNLQYAVEFGNDEINDDDPTYLWYVEPKIFKDYQIAPEQKYDEEEQKKAAAALQGDNLWSMEVIYDMPPFDISIHEFNCNSDLGTLIELINEEMCGYLRIVQSYYLENTNIMTNEL